MGKDFNFRLVAKMIGSLLFIESLLLLSMSLIPIIYEENDMRYFLISGGITFGFATLLFLLGLNAKPLLGKREGSVIVTFTWVLFSLFGMLPFWLSGSIPSVTDAFFETMSGFTTTGASILNNIEELSHGILFWRSMTHWIGGLGIIVISLALLPLFGYNGMQLFAAESSGPTKDKIHPKINETAKRLFAIYVMLNVAETILLKLGGMSWFDAVCHSFATTATGGFSTKQASIGYWNSPYIEYVVIIFMILSGVNFSLYYFAYKHKFEKIISNEELKYYLILLFSAAGLIAFSRMDFSSAQTFGSIEKAIRDSLFYVSSIMSTTGFVTVDYMQWKTYTWIILLIVMITGASAGSTTGGIKMVRIVIVAKYCYYEFKQIIHPNAIFPVRYNGHLVKEDIITKILAFVLLYLTTIAVGTLILAMTGMGFEESISGVISSLSCVGPGLGSIGPMGTYAHIPEFSKWFLSFMMLVGRLELFTVFLLFTPTFWKK